METEPHSIEIQPHTLKMQKCTVISEHISSNTNFSKDLALILLNPTTFFHVIKGYVVHI